MKEVDAAALLLLPRYGKTLRYTVYSAAGAVDEAEILVKASKWFMVTPLPDDYYEFRVKDE